MRRIALTAAVLLMLSQTASADWKRDYDRGVKAAEDGNWAEAEALMRSALAEEPNAEARKRFQGTVWKPYVPHYYAGLAAWRQGRCEQALQYWRNRSGASAIAELGELGAQQNAGVAECTRRLAATATPPATTTAATQAPITTPSSTSSTSTRPPVATPPPASTNTTTRPPPTSVATATPSPAATTTRPAPAPTRASPAPAALVDAVESYLGGRYDAVVRLDPASFADGRSRAQAFLLRAAARYTLAELSGDARARQQAQQDVRAARAANASLAPDAVLFSPRFREFWKQAQ